MVGFYYTINNVSMPPTFKSQFLHLLLWTLTGVMDILQQGFERIPHNETVNLNIGVFLFSIMYLYFVPVFCHLDFVFCNCILY